MDIRCLILAVALAGGAAIHAPARTWTSASGSTVEAELAGHDGSFVILQRPNGSQLKIDVRNLSRADQDYLADQEKSVPAAPADAPPAAAPGQAFGPVAFQSPPALSTSAIPGVTPLAPASTGYLGFQFGPGPDDVLYVVVDPADPFELPEHVYLYVPHHPMYGTPRKVEGKKGKYNDERVMTFSKIQVSATFDSLRATYEIELVVGIERPDVVAMVVEAQLLDNGKSTKLLYGGYVNEKMQLGEGTIPMVRAWETPVLTANVRTTTIQPTVAPVVTMGPFRVRPASKKIKMRVLTVSGKTAEKTEHEVTEEDVLAYGHGGTRIRLIEVKAGTAYTLTATADMGPSIGELTFTKSFKTKGAVER